MIVMVGKCGRQAPRCKLMEVCQEPGDSDSVEIRYTCGYSGLGAATPRATLLPGGRDKSPVPKPKTVILGGDIHS